MSREVVGYRYETPESEELAGFDVVRTNHGQAIDTALAMDVQTIIKESLTAQLQDTSIDVLRQVIETFRNPRAVKAQRKRLAESTGQANHPLYVHAQFSRTELRKPDDFKDLVDPDASWVVGIGKAKYADGRPRHKRVLQPGADKAANLADVGDTYVLPQHAEARISQMQGQGVGSAILRTMLDHYPEDMPAIVYEYPALNPRITPLLQGLGFRAIKTAPGNFCGIETPQTLYAGPFCGDLVETLESRQGWLKEREPLYLRLDK